MKKIITITCLVVLAILVVVGNVVGIAKLIKVPDCPDYFGVCTFAWILGRAANIRFFLKGTICMNSFGSNFLSFILGLLYFPLFALFYTSGWEMSIFILVMGALQGHLHNTAWLY